MVSKKSEFSVGEPSPNTFGRIRHKFSRYAKPVVEPGEGAAQQHFKDECDINKILAKYHREGIITHVKQARQMYGDFSGVLPAAEMLSTVKRAEQMFELIPAELRNKFHNSIPGFLDFIGKKENFDQCVQWGIYDPPPKAPDAVTPPAPPADAPKPPAKEKKAP